MSSTTEELTYHGRPLDPNPTHMSLGEVAARLLEDRRVQVILEPGDGTRYDFILAPIALTVCNFECGGLDALNEWSWQLFHWWLRKLWERIEA